MSNQKQSFWRYENGILLLMCLGYGLIFTDRFSITNIFPQIAQGLHLNNTQLGETMSVVAFAWGISSFVFAYISDVMGKRKVMLVTLVFVFSLSTLFSGMASVFIAFLLSRALLGIAEGPAIPLIQSTVMAESTQSRKGLNTGLPIAVSSLMGAAAPLLLVWLAQSFSWRVALYTITVPGLILGFFLMKYMREPQAMVKSEVKSGTKAKLNWADLKIVLKTRNVWISMFVAIFFVGGSIAAVNTFAPLFLINIGHLKQTQAAGIMTIFGLVGLIGNLFIPWLSDKIGRKKAFMLAAFMSILVPLSLILFHSSPALIIIALIILSGGQATAGLCMFIIPGESVPARLMATATSLPNLVGEVIGGTLGSLIAGHLADVYGLMAPMIFATIVVFFTFVLSFAYKETHPKFAKKTAIDEKKVI